MLFKLILDDRRLMADTDIPVPRVQFLKREDRRGTYVMKEKIEKAPDYQHSCNLTRTVVEVTFPEMKEAVFMNLLGYKGSNLIEINRCKGRVWISSLELLR